jgi:hypothetical protein
MQIMLAKDAVKIYPRVYRELNEGKILGKSALLITGTPLQIMMQL